MTPYVYLKSEPGLWTVGFYAPNGTWRSESDHVSPDDAAKRCNWLNGRGTYPSTSQPEIVTALLRAYTFLDANFDEEDMADILEPCREALGKAGALPAVSTTRARENPQWTPEEISAIAAQARDTLRFNRIKITEHHAVPKGGRVMVGVELTADVKQAIEAEFAKLDTALARIMDPDP